MAKRKSPAKRKTVSKRVAASKYNVPADWYDIIMSIPGYDPFRDAAGCHFDPDEAQFVLDFIPKAVKHVEGQFAGKPFEPEGWQIAPIANMWGWRRKDGTRRYRVCFIYVPRKNGKTTLTAALVVVCMYTDDEPAGQLYSAAADREQAALVYRQVQGMIVQQPELAGLVKVLPSFKSIEHQQSMSVYRAISADARRKHGFNSSVVVVDELHAQPNRELVDVLETSTGSRAQPLSIYLTTADYDRESICNEKYAYFCKVRDGDIADPTALPVIYEASIDDDWTSPKVWAQANPNLGVSLRVEYMESKCREAQDNPAFENTFKRLHLNIKTEQAERIIQMHEWDACAGGETIDQLRARLRGRPCVAGLDLASKADTTSLVLLFRNEDEDGQTSVDVLAWFWVPEARAEIRERRDNVPYRTWARQGYMEMTAGSAIDNQHIRRRINEIAKDYPITEIGADPFNGTELLYDLAENDGFSVVEVRQGFISMNEPTKDMIAKICSHRLRHGGNPALRWQASCLAVEHDSANNIKPSKKHSTDRIDGIVAMVTGWARGMSREPEVVPYQGGVLVL